MEKISLVLSNDRPLVGKKATSTRASALQISANNPNIENFSRSISIIFYHKTIASVYF
jgi:hypothetical protein